MGPALICAADEGKGLSQKEKMELSMYWRLGTKDVPQSQAPVEKNKKTHAPSVAHGYSLSYLLLWGSRGFYQIQIHLFLFPFILHSS